MSRFTKAEDMDISEISGCNMNNYTRAEVNITFDEFKGATASSALFLIADEDYWIPRGQIIGAYDDQVVITEWIALKKELI